MRKKFLCVECAHNHKFGLLGKQLPTLPGYVLIDGEKWISYLRSPSHKVKCSECGKRTREVFEVMKNEK